eukprot:SAG31_NODE_2442_length_5683_cov_8.114792_8_plen_230_part_01
MILNSYFKYYCETHQNPCDAGRCAGLPGSASAQEEACQSTDLNADGRTDVIDLLQLLSFFGCHHTAFDEPCASNDINQDDQVNVIDILEVLAAFGCEYQVSPCAAAPCGAGVCNDISATTYSCDCAEGYTFDDETCTDTNGCESAPCFDGVECYDQPAPLEGFTCDLCPEGLEGDGQTCEEQGEDPNIAVLEALMRLTVAGASVEAALAQDDSEACSAFTAGFASLVVPP